MLPNNISSVINKYTFNKIEKSIPEETSIYFIIFNISSFLYNISKNLSGKNVVM